MPVSGNGAELREKVIERIRDELRKVDAAMGDYVPEAAILEGSSLTIRIALDEITTVHADFVHPA